MDLLLFLKVEQGDLGEQNDFYWAIISGIVGGHGTNMQHSSFVT